MQMIVAILYVYRGRGIARKILFKLAKIIGPRECYCLPWDHLEQFYGSIGFQKIDPKQAPKHLKDRAEEYYEKYKNIIAMKRPAAQKD